jgi:phosphate uptake regulator
MADVVLEDHLVGVEQQLVELVEQRERARVQEQADEVARIDREIDRLYDEMATTAARIIDRRSTAPHIGAPHAA